jgi:hypothetical protein
MIGGNYHTLMNDALKQFAQGLKLYRPGARQSMKRGKHA